MQSETNNASAKTGFVDRYLPELDGGRAASGGSADISFDMIRSIVWRQRYIILSVVGLALTLGLIGTLLRTPIYKAEAKVRVDVYTGTVIEGQDLTDPILPSNYIGAYLETLVQVVQSRRLAIGLVNYFNLQNNKELLGNVPNTQQPGLSAQAIDDKHKQMAAEILQKHVSAEVVPASQIISISYSSPDPRLAATVANDYANRLIQSDIDQAIQTNSYARHYLEKRIEVVRGQLKDAQLRAINYARENNIITATHAANNQDSNSNGKSGSEVTLTTSNLLYINQKYTDAKAAMLDAQERWLAIQNIPPAQLPDVQQNSAVQNLQAQVAQLTSQLADLRQRYRDDYPKVRELRSQVDTLNQQISTLGTDIKNGIHDQYLVAQRQETRLADELKEASDASLKEQDKQVQFDQINRQVATLQSQLDNLMNRYNQISSAANLRSNKLSLLDGAVIPKTPSSPKLFKNMLVALVLGIALAGLIAMLRETLDDKLRSIEDVERRLGFPALGQVPFTLDDVDDKIGERFTPIAEAYSSIRASLDYRLGSVRNSVIQITSTTASEGKSTSAAALARVYASVGRKVLLVDMDLRRPSLGEKFHLRRSEVGLLDVLYSRNTIADAVEKTDQDRLDLLLLESIPSHPIEVLSSGLIHEFLQIAKSRYDIIIVDSSPVLGIADAPLLSRFVDAVVVVVEANRSTSREVRMAMRRMNDVSANIVGVILTKFKAIEAGQSYNNAYQYYAYANGN